MFDELIDAVWDLGHMLLDLQESFQDMHPDDVAEALRNCG